MKKLFITLCVLFLLSVNVGALEKGDITLTDEFTEYYKNPEVVALILKTDKATLEKQLQEQGTKFLAVNSDNSKQIQLTVTKTDFSTQVGDIEVLTEESLKTLLPEITGIKNVTGEILLNGGKKYVRTDIKSQNGENDYILSQFFTISDGNLEVLSFYTSDSVSTEYIDGVFPTQKLVNEDTPEFKKIPPIFKICCIIGTIILGGVCAVLIFTVVKDVFHKEEAEADELEEIE